MFKRILANLGLLSIIVLPSEGVVPEEPPWPDEPMCSVVYDLNLPPVEIPCSQAQQASKVWMECEVKGWWAHYARPADVVSPTKDYGTAQVNIIHKPTMAKVGLNFYSEHDRLHFATHYLLANQGWQPWSCRHMLGL